MSGASETTLHRRAVYYRGGRKARSAAKRLRAMGLTPGRTHDGWRILKWPYVILPGVVVGVCLDI